MYFLWIIYILLFINSINTQDLEAAREASSEIINILGGLGGNNQGGGISINGIYFSRPNFKQKYGRYFNISDINITNFQTIQCQNQNDFNLLLYQICALEHICNEIYYISEDSILNSIDFTNYDSVTRLFYSKEFKKFSYQLNSINLFIYRIENSTDYLQPTFLNLWPLSWVPPFIIQFNQSQSEYCFQSIDILTDNNLHFMYSSLDLLKTFKLFVTNDIYCNDHNEKLVLNYNYQFVCICKNGKSCDNEPNFKKLIIFLFVSLILLLILWIITTAISSITTLRNISLINKNLNSVKNKKQI